MIEKIISVRSRILEFFLPLFEKLSVINGDFFWSIFWWNLMAFCLSFPKWCNTYTLAEKIKALEHQTFSTHFTSKFMLFWITQKLTFFTHPNIKIAKNGNVPIHWRGFHAFFKNSWPSPPPKISRIVTSFSCRNIENSKLYFLMQYKESKI